MSRLQRVAHLVVTLTLAFTLTILTGGLLAGCRTDSLTPTTDPSDAGYTVWFHVETGDIYGLPTSRDVDTFGLALQSDTQVAIRVLDRSEAPGNYMVTGTTRDPVVIAVPPGTGNADRRPYTLPRSTPLLFPQTLNKNVVSASLTVTLHGEPGETISCYAEVNKEPVSGSYKLAEIKATATAAEVTCLQVY